MVLLSTMIESPVRPLRSSRAFKGYMVQCVANGNEAFLFVDTA